MFIYPHIIAEKSVSG